MIFIKKLKKIELNFWKKILKYNEDDEFVKDIAYNFKFIILGLILILYSLTMNTTEYYINKKEIQVSLKNAIIKNADINTLNDILFYFPIIKKKTNYNYSEFYPNDVNLKKILTDIKIDFYINNSNSLDPLTLKINDLIQEIDLKNPFYGLENREKELLENIKFKSKENYSYISTDINSLVIEIKNKDKTIKQYLASSNLSLVVSIISLLIGIGNPLLKTLLKIWNKK